MNEQLQQALAALINKLVTSIDGVAGQVPDLIRQLIEYTAFQTLLWMVWFTFLAVISIIYLSWYGYKICKGDLENWGENQNIWGGLFCLGFSVMLLCAGYNLVAEWITYTQLTQNPNTWVLDYLRSMLK